jgi:Rieske Fe-S protein
MYAHEQFQQGRRKMILTMGWLLLIPLAGLWDLMVKRKQARQDGNVSKVLLAGIPMGISFYEDYWISRNELDIKVYSTRCTHLGCKVKPAGDDRLTCACHGSAFSTENGSSVRGPAQKSLDVLNYIIDGEYLTIFIK